MIAYVASPSSGWLRVLGWGLSWTREPPLFSERNGYAKRYRIPLTEWRIGVLTRIK